MKVNFYDCFKDFDGQPLHINGEPQLVSRIVAQCLFNGTGIRPVVTNRRMLTKNYGHIACVCR